MARDIAANSLQKPLPVPEMKPTISGVVPPKKKSEKSKNSAAAATASGGAALNTSLVVQNIAQVKLRQYLYHYSNNIQMKKLLQLRLCSLEFSRTKNKDLHCDSFWDRSTQHQMVLILIACSLFLQLIYGR